MKNEDLERRPERVDRQDRTGADLFLVMTLCSLLFSLIALAVAIKALLK